MPPPNKRITSNMKGVPRRGRGVTAAPTATMTKWMLTFVLLGVFVATASAVDEIQSTETKTVQPSPSPSSLVVSSSSGRPRDEIYIDDESIEGSGGRGEIHDDLEKEPDYSGSGFGPDDEDSSTGGHHQRTHNSGTISSNNNNNGNINNNNNNNDISSRINYSSNSNSGIIGSSNSNSNSASSSNSGINSIGKDILPSATSNTTTQFITSSTSKPSSTSKSDILPGSSDFDFGGGVVGSGDGRDTDDEDDDEDDDDDGGSIGGIGRPDDDDDEDDEDEDDYGSEDVNTDKTNRQDGNAGGYDEEYDQNGNDKTEIYTDVTDPSEGSEKTRLGGDNTNQGNELDTTNINNLPTDTKVEHTTGNEVLIMNTNEDDRTTSFFAQPGILAAVIGGAVVGLLCAILVVMFIVYRMRKKDEGSYALDEPKRSPAVNSYAKNGNNREFYA